MSVVIQTVAGD